MNLAEREGPTWKLKPHPYPPYEFQIRRVRGILIPMPLFALPLISVLIAPVAALVLLKLIQTFVPIRRFPTVWVSVTYVLLIIQAVGISVMLSRSLPNN